MSREYTAAQVYEWIRHRGYLPLEQHKEFGYKLPTSNMGACMEALAEALGEIERAEKVLITDELETILQFPEQLVEMKDQKMRLAGLLILCERVKDFRQRVAGTGKERLPRVRKFLERKGWSCEQAQARLDALAELDKWEGA